MALEEYRRKRDFGRTPEPAGMRRSHAPAGRPLSFVIQKHAARRLHYDFRLELDGVLKSWAVPKGPSLDPAEKRLAVEVENHPLEYGGFEGIIPEGEYGGGTVLLWDRGTWAPTDPDPEAAWRGGTLKFALDGEKLRGDWVLVRIRGNRKEDRGRRNWLLIKERDGEAIAGSGDAVVIDHPLSVASGRSLDRIASDRDRIWDPQQGEVAAGPTAAPAAAPPPASAIADIAGARPGPLPGRLAPQLASLAQQAPDGAEWLHEIKYDGYRLMARIDRGKIRLITRGGLDWTGKFPELARSFAALPVETALLDGEIVSLMPDGSSSFSGLQEAISTGETQSLIFFAFDLLHGDGWDLSGATLLDRKAALAAIIAPRRQDLLRYSDHQAGQGPAFFAEVCRHGLEGIVSKRRDAPYRAGRGPGWLKIKCGNRDEFVVVGFTDPEGSREGFGALLLGYYDPQQRLCYAGRVGTGFSAARLTAMRRQLDALVRPEPTVALPKGVSRKGTHWVAPRLVAEIRFGDWTADAILRHAAFLGLRDDKDPKEVVYDPKSRTAMSRAGGSAERGRAATARPAPRARDGSLDFSGVRLSHPDRILYSDPPLTKLGLAEYYAAVAEWALPQLAGRPLTLLRAPAGQGQKSFYQKHLGAGVPATIRRFEIAGEDGVKPCPVIEDLAGLVGLVQMGVLEIHPWGSTIADIEAPDRVTFDLDPDQGLPWSRVSEAALGLRRSLAAIGLDSFLKATGGKGLHVVVPLRPKLPWDAVKTFAKWVADSMAEASPAEFTANPALRARHGRIYVDYLRNTRGATAIGAYSPRARAGAPVSAPLEWSEIEAGAGPPAFTVATVLQRLAGLDRDPWAEIGKRRQSLSATVRRRVGI